MSSMPGWTQGHIRQHADGHTAQAVCAAEEALARGLLAGWDGWWRGW